jgi:hypothetical protein
MISGGGGGIGDVIIINNLCRKILDAYKNFF